jgi:hypothetical protein
LALKLAWKSGLNNLSLFISGRVLRKCAKELPLFS